MGKSAPKLPKAPDPNFLSALQRKENNLSAKQNTAYKQYGIQTPFASVHYSGDIGSPNRTKHINLSKPVVERMRKDEAFNDVLHDHALNTLSQMPKTSHMPILPEIQPIDPITVSKRESELFHVGKRALDKDYKQSEKRLDIQLGQRGVPQSSKAYQKSMRGLRKSKIDALSSLSSQASQRARAESLNKFKHDIAIRNQKLNESLVRSNEGMKKLNAAFTHLKQSSPQHYTRYLSHLNHGNQSGFKPMDISGHMHRNLRDQMAYHQAKEKYNNSLFGGLLSLGKTFL